MPNTAEAPYDHADNLDVVNDEVARSNTRRPEARAPSGRDARRLGHGVPRRDARDMIEMLQATVPAMRAKKWGRVVALESTSVKQPIGNLVLSNAFRKGLVAALKTLASEVAADGVTVNSIATGRVITARTQHLYGSEEAAEKSARAEVPAQRQATPAVACVVAVLIKRPNERDER